MANDLIMISARTPVVDPDTGMINRDWFRFFELMGRKAQVVDGDITLAAVAGTAAALPALPAGYMTINLAGANYKVPYYK